MAEFAESMGMKEDSLFVQQVFKQVDADRSGTVNYKEFLQFVILFTQGSRRSKMELMFNIYDVDGNGKLERGEFIHMLKRIAEEANESVDDGHLDKAVDDMFRGAGLSNRATLTLDDFIRMFSDYSTDIGDTVIQLGRHRTSRPSLASTNTAKDSSGLLPSETGNEAANQFRQRVMTGLQERPPKKEPIERQLSLSPIQLEPLPVEEEIGQGQVSQKQQHLLAIQRIWENYRLQIFWLSFYILVTLAIFGERAYYYSVEREHNGLRRIAGYGVTVTRGAASAMMFTYSSLLVTMSRNIITLLRETFLNRFIPFDSAIAAHKVFAIIALIFTIVHCAGHGINFYHISTQTANDLTCLFREYYHLSDELPKFQFWMFNTLTGVTGFVLVLVVVTMYTFALPFARRYLFKTFWYTHHLYIALYFLLILHGSGRLVQPPIFQWYFIFPVAVFALDKLISISRKRVELAVYKAEKLPSGVTHLQFKKPTNFDYRSGQWVRIACLSLNSEEYHPFTLTSAPHEPTLDLYIRAVGPWTGNIRDVYDPENPKNHDPETNAQIYPRLFLDGPFGEGHQEWYKFPVAVLVGGGIGVTPFASILKDVVYKQSVGAHIGSKKVYFLWVTRTQKQFEWMTEIVRQVEQEDKKELTDTHIFITQFYEKFDLRTIMLYICERHSKRVSGRSLFTGLRATTHFGRPQFDSFFGALQELHGNERQIGVFSCGPPPMTRSVEAGCAHCNRFLGPVFVHHYENF